MSEADLFRQYAKEAMYGASKVTDEDAKRNLVNLACTWLQAALASERVFGSSIILSPLDVGGATASTRS